MFQFSRTYQHTAEFEARQSGFGFAVVARAVLVIARATKQRLQAMFSTWRKGFVTPTSHGKKAHQLVLELDALPPMHLPCFQP